MLISCPNCHAVYDISTKKLPENGKKFKCAECSNIWTVYPSDEIISSEAEKPTADVPSTPTNTQQNTVNVFTQKNNKPQTDADLEAMFSRLSQNTKTLFASASGVDSMNIVQKIRHYILNSVTAYAIIAFLLPISILLGGMILYKYRYDIAAKIPGMDYVYAKMDYDSLYKGKDLVIEDVNIHNIRLKGHSNLEISGKIRNNGSHIVTLLPIKAEIINSEGMIIDEQIQQLQKRQIEPDFGALFRIVMKRPNQKAEKIRISLKDN